MALSMALSRAPLSRWSFRLSPLKPAPFFTFSRYSSSIQLQPNCKISSSASLPTEESMASPLQFEAPNGKKLNWKPLCLYYTQGKCTKMDDPVHVDRFNHSCSLELESNGLGLKNFRAQKFDYFLVLDLEGKVEILEFPVLLFDAKTMNVVDLFHRFVMPTKMSDQRINEYIEGKYGKIGIDGVWHDTAIAFDDVIQQFEAWLAKHHLWRKEQDGLLKDAAFVTCGNWDLKTKVPQQCVVARMKLPPYFMEWINLKDIYLNFYKRRAPGMISMMRELQIPLLGSHHVGIDDTRNIARVMQRMLLDGALLQLTARRTAGSPNNVQFLFENRI
ncbi:putative exonuclease domain-containing protein [Abeliophyllum distichum]|uniref:Exonuclease domain-containing protein n=1 Tax=Abeliophyllum distichum TaxID=126358 RepID=A0ABD1UFN4_9LAMI